MNLPMWQMWSGVLTDSDVNNIIEVCEKFPEENAKVGDDSTVQGRADEAVRRSHVHWVRDRGMYELCWDYAMQANRNAFGFQISCVGDVQYTKYYGNDNGKYDWHFDTFWQSPDAFHRKLSVTIQLSDSSDYEGGDFQYDPQYPSPDPQLLRKKGTIFIFPSYISHRVTEVTKGTRKSLVSWIEGPRFR